MPMEIAKVKATCEEFRLAGYRMEKIAKTAYEQLKSADIPCESPFFYRGLAELIQVGKNGLISIEEKKDDKKFEYLSVHIPKRYTKTIESIMKNLGIERHLYCPVVNNRQ